VNQTKQSVRQLVIAAALIAFTSTQVPAVAPPFCAGDCGDDGRVTIEELIAVVAIALGLDPGSACAAADADGDGEVQITDVLLAVRSALDGCGPPSPTPTTLATPTPTEIWTFTDVTVSALGVLGSDCETGAAAADIDGDSLLDLLVGEGAGGAPALLRNAGDGSFVDVTARMRLTPPIGCPTGVALADYDGDGHLDAFFSASESAFGTGPSLVVRRNRGDGTFEPTDLGFDGRYSRQSLTFGDFDRDGDLDLYVSTWSARASLSLEPIHHLWRNDGSAGFRPVDEALPTLVETPMRPDCDSCTAFWDFTANFSDINHDGWPDLLLAADFGTSRVFLNQHDGRFADTTTSVISDENGMGAAVGDYDNDGDLDWFVTGIRHNAPGRPCDAGPSGNRLYRNRGDGSFEDATDRAGVRDGGWGWGACFADFNNDGWLDLYHVNGWPFCSELGFADDPAVLFLSNGDGTFTERAAALGVADRGQGRGVVCFDYDADGDIDILVVNQLSPPRLFRNDLPRSNAYLTVRLRGLAPNTQGIGAKVWLRTGSRTQMREIRAGSNYLSQDPAEAHFGLGPATVVDEVRVEWPNGQTSQLNDVAANQLLLIGEPVVSP
jgi:enediyne biosynthesis protein E4